MSKAPKAAAKPLARDSKGRPIGRRRDQRREIPDTVLTPELVERCYREGKVHYEMAQSFDALMVEVVSFKFACDQLDSDSWIDREIGIRAHTLALKFRLLSSALTKLELGEAATVCLRAVAAIVETARAGSGVGPILKELEAVRQKEIAWERLRNGPGVLARVIELAWSTEEWLLRGNWNQRWASICNLHFLGVPDRALAKPAGVTANALRVARRKARTRTARHDAYAALNMLGLCEPARLPESVVPVLKNAIDGESFAPVVRQQAARILMASDVREQRQSAASLLRETIQEVGDNDEGRLEMFATILECAGTPGWIDDEDDERYLEWQEEIANQHF